MSQTNGNTYTNGDGASSGSTGQNTSGGSDGDAGAYTNEESDASSRFYLLDPDTSFDMFDFEFEGKVRAGSVTGDPNGSVTFDVENRPYDNISTYTLTGAHEHGARDALGPWTDDMRVKLTYYGIVGHVKKITLIERSGEILK